MLLYVRKMNNVSRYTALIVVPGSQNTSSSRLTPVPNVADGLRDPAMAVRLIIVPALICVVRKADEPEAEALPTREYIVVRTALVSSGER